MNYMILIVLECQSFKKETKQTVSHYVCICTFRNLFEKIINYSYNFTLKFKLASDLFCAYEANFHKICWFCANLLNARIVREIVLLSQNSNLSDCVDNEFLQPAVRYPGLSEQS
jgi:hypothetical protein